MPDKKLADFRKKWGFYNQLIEFFCNFAPEIINTNSNNHFLLTIKPNIKPL